MRRSVFWRMLCVMLLMVVMQQLLGAVFGAVYYVVNSGLVDKVMADPSLTKDTTAMMALVDMNELTIANVGVGLSVSSLVFVAVMFLTKMAKSNVSPTTWQSLLWAVLLVFPASLLGNVVAELAPVDDMLQGVMEKAMRTPWGMLSIGVIGPIAEEVCFRMGMLGYCVHLSRETGDYRYVWTGLIWSSVLFGMLHINPAQVVFAVPVGLLFGWVYLQTGTVWPCIVMHVINNSTAILLSRLFPDTTSVIELLGGSLPTTIAAIVSVAAIWLLLTRYRYIAPPSK